MPLQIARYTTNEGDAVAVTCDAMHHDPETGIVTFYKSSMPVAAVDIATVKNADIHVSLVPPECSEEVKLARGLLGLAQLNAAFMAVVNKATAPRVVAPYRNLNKEGR